MFMFDFWMLLPETIWQNKLKIITPRNKNVTNLCLLLDTICTVSNPKLCHGYRKRSRDKTKSVTTNKLVADNKLFSISLVQSLSYAETLTNERLKC